MRKNWAIATNVSAATRYYPSTRGMEVSAGDRPLRKLVQFEATGGVTITVEFTAHDSTAGDGAADVWTDVTDDCKNLIGATAASYVDTAALLDVSHLPGRWRIKVVTSDASNAFRVAYSDGPGSPSGVQSAATGAATEARQTSATCVSVAAKTAPATPAAATAIAATTAAKCGVLVSADLTNGGTIALGGSGVAIGTGVELQAGDSVFLPVSDPALVYCVGSAAAQVLRVVVL